MEVIFNKFNQFETYEIYLCNPNKKQLNVVIGNSANVKLRLNDLSELSIEVPKYLTNSKSEKVEQPCYELLQGKRLLLVSNIGYFEITNVVENDDENGVYKIVSAESHQATFKSRLGFTTEERIYKFYNSADPYDDNYDSNDASSVPSVVGQLNKQLGILVNLQDQDNEATTDYDYWTITYIDDTFRYGTGDSDGIYRSFTDNETNGYDFMVNDVEEAFEMIWEFDFLHHTIKAKGVKSITTPTDIYLSFDNLIQTLEVTENAENIKTVLSCNGSDLDIRTINPMGTNYIVNFDYYKNKDDTWMSEELIEVLNKWEEVYKSKEDEFSELVLDLRSHYEQQTKYENIITDSQLRISDLTNARDQYLINYPLLAETVMAGEESADLHSEFNTGALNINNTYLCYKKPPTVENETYIFNTTGRENTLEDNFEKGYIYFQDNDINSYCKIIQDDDGTYGIERYAQFDKVADWCEYTENTGFLVSCENVGIGENSLLSDSYFKENKFVRDDGTIFKCYAKQPKLVGGVYTFDDDTDFLEGTFNECGNNEYLYFIDGSSTSYCKINMSAEVDAETTTVTYYASGFTRFTTISNVTTWIDLWESYNKEIEDANTLLQDNISSVTSEMQAISNECNILSYIENHDKTGTLKQELQSYWIEGEYKNENLAVLDSTTMEERIDLAKELKETGENELKRVSQPSFSFTITSLDFLKLPQFKKFSSQLKLGRVITVEKSDSLFYKPAVTEIEFNLYDSENFSLTFSNSLKLNQNDFTFVDLVAQAVKVSDNVISNWGELISYSKNKDTITELIANPLDRSLKAGLTNMVNQEFTIDSTGILGRKYEDDSKSSFLDEQMRIMNNTILFTDDNWETVKTALGKIYYNDENGNERSAYGLVAQTIIGNLIMSETLDIANSDSTIKIDKDGIKIISDGITVFNANTNGDVSITGNIQALSGYIGDEQEGFIIEKNYIYHNIDDVDTRVLIGSGTDDFSSYEVCGKSLTNLMLLAGENFAVTNDGSIYADKGLIGGLSLKTSVNKDNEGNEIKISGLYSDGFVLESQTSDNKKYTSVLGFEGNYYFPAGTTLYIYNEDSNTYSESGEELQKYYSVNNLSENFIEYDESYFLKTSDAQPYSLKISPQETYITNAYINSLISEKINVEKMTIDAYCEIYSTNKTYTSYFDDDGNVLTTPIKRSVKELNIENKSTGAKINLGAYGSETYSYYYKVTWTVDSNYFTITHYDESGSIINSLEEVKFRIYVQPSNWFGSLENNVVTFPKDTKSVTYSTMDINGKEWFWGIKSVYFNNGSTKYPYETIREGQKAITVEGNIIPNVTNFYWLGTKTNCWEMVYANSYSGESYAGESDKNLKKDIKYLSDEYEELFDKLKPASYKFKSGKSGRTHIGFIAQDVKEATEESGLTTQDFAAYIEEKQSNNEVTCALRYDEFIPLCVKEIQKLKERVTELENSLVVKQ